MATAILATKLYVPPPPKAGLRPRLIERLNEGLHCKLVLVSAPAGFGKTTLVSEWVARCERAVAWRSLEEGDNDLTRFLTYFIAALQTLALSDVRLRTTAEGIVARQSPVGDIGERVLAALQSPIDYCPGEIAIQDIEDLEAFLDRHRPDWSASCSSCFAGANGCDVSRCFRAPPYPGQ